MLPALTPLTCKDCPENRLPWSSGSPAGRMQVMKNTATITGTVTVSTDGSALSNPNGPMGWGWAEHTDTTGGHIASSTGRDCDCGGASNGTNQIGELCAVLQALRTHRGSYCLTIESDSQYAIKCSTIWLEGWKKNGWKNSKHEPVKNAPLIKAIDREISERPGPVSFTWVKGHAGNMYNEKVDSLARGYAGKCQAGLAPDYLPYEGWQSLISSVYGHSMTIPDNPSQAPQADDYLAADQTSRPEADKDTTKEGSRNRVSNSATAPTIETTETTETTVAHELLAQIRSAADQFNLAAQRLENASAHMDKAIASLDEAIRRFDDSSWDNNHQDTLF